MRGSTLQDIPLDHLGWSIGDSREKHALHYNYSLERGPITTYTGNINLEKKHKQALKRIFEWALNEIGSPETYEILGKTISPFYEVSGIKRSIIGNTFGIPDNTCQIDLLLIHPSEQELGPTMLYNEKDLPAEINELLSLFDELLWDCIRKSLVQRFKLSEDSIPKYLKKHVFLAYRSNNKSGKKTARKLGKFLKEKGIRVWLFPWEVGWSDSITEAEEQAIRNSFGAVICFTSDFLNGQTAIEEYRALSAKRRRDPDFKLGLLLVGCNYDIIPPFMQDYFGAKIENYDDENFECEANRIYRGLFGLPLEPTE